MKLRINVIITTAFLIPLLVQVQSYADLSPEKHCEARYVDSLKNAKEALLHRRREDAIKFLLNATTIMEACARSREKPHPKEQAGENQLALSQAILSPSENAHSEFHRSL